MPIWIACLKDPWILVFLTPGWPLSTSGSVSASPCLRGLRWWGWCLCPFERVTWKSLEEKNLRQALTSSVRCQLLLFCDCLSLGKGKLMFWMGYLLEAGGKRGQKEDSIQVTSVSVAPAVGGPLSLGQDALHALAWTKVVEVQAL